MGAHAIEAETTVVPALRYRNVPAAIDWLCKAFGFEQDFVVRGESGAIRYVQLTCGRGMVMVGPAPESSGDSYMRQPDEVGGIETQTCYFYLEDVKTHYARAKAAGAEIVLDIDDRSAGGLGYSCRDPEGHVWNFGTFDPWSKSKRRRAPAPPKRPARGRGLRTALIATPLLAIPLLGAVLLVPSPLQERLTAFALIALEGVTAEDEARAREPLAAEPRISEASEHAVLDAREQLAEERSAREAAEAANREVREQVAQLRRAFDQAARSAQEARDQLVHVPAAKQGSIPSGESARAELAKALKAKEAAEAALTAAREELAQAHTTRDTAERNAKDARDRAARERSARLAAERAAAAAKNGPTVGPLGF
jgi:uncharacterized glyoxalase superfamily protein PhnB